ncbi:MAG: pilin [Patescibacteria group bacterium]|nr:pilin [Patescibacteria group bacterium]
MRKRLPKLLIYFFLVMFIIQMASLLALILLPQPAQADPVQFQPQVPIPGSEFQKGSQVDVSGSTNAIGKYIQAIYNYSIGIVGILATVVLMFGGISWIMAGGSAERVGNAKAWIGAALSGLVLALCSYVILNTINPDLVNFRIRTIAEVDIKTSNNTTVCCQFSDGCANMPETECKSGGYGGEIGIPKQNKKCVDIDSHWMCEKKGNWYYNFWSLQDLGGNSKGPFDTKYECSYDKNTISRTKIVPYGDCYESNNKNAKEDETCGNDGGVCKEKCTLLNIDWGGINCASGYTCCLK